MITLDYNLNAEKNGGKITAFTYSHSLNELAGSWSAQVAGGTFTAGDSISFSNVMTNGIISKARKDSSGLWHVEGYDAGIRLMCSVPDIASLPTGNARNVILYLAGKCGIDVSMVGVGLFGFNVRSVISGSTCAEAILELAMFSGYIAFIGSDGKLHVQEPNNMDTPNFQYVIDDSGSDFDLDNYATQATIILRKSSISDVEEEQPEPVEYYTGTTPLTSTSSNTHSGSFSNGSYSVTILKPFDVVTELETTITENGVTITTEEEHEYDYEHKTIWRDNQEYVLFAFIETGYTLTKTVTGTYTTQNSDVLSFSEVTTETMTRSLSPFDAIGVPDDWKGQLGMVDSETITRSTVRTGAPTPTQDMPAYSPPFDSIIERRYSRGLRGKSLVCKETEKRYEARQVGAIAPVKVNGENVPFYNRNLAIQTHTKPEWVEIDTYCTYVEQYDNDGNCIFSARSEYCDDGAKWLTEHALTDTGDEELNEYQEAYAKFSQDSQGLEISLGSSVLTTAWRFLELQGRMKNSTETDPEGTSLGNIKDWYSNGEYISSYECPHYNDSTRSCNIFTIDKTISGEDCISSPHSKFAIWRTDCSRARKALEIARKQEKKQLDSPIIGRAILSPGVSYSREIYVDSYTDILEDQMRLYANTIAQNVLKVKGVKGLRKTVTIPYDPTLAIDGAIVAISHDWENLQSTVTYRVRGTIPDFLVAQSVSGIASFVAARETSRLSSPKYGVVSEIKDNLITVSIGNTSVKCTTKLKNLGVGDNVLVSFSGGNKLRGQIISRL